MRHWIACRHALRRCCGCRPPACSGCAGRGARIAAAGRATRAAAGDGQPAVPSSTLPVGATPVVVAAKVTLAPAVDGLAGAGAAWSSSLIGALELTHLRQRAAGGRGIVAPSRQRSAATMLRAADGQRVRRWHRWRCAHCRPPVRATALQPAMDTPPSLKLTPPVGATPVVVAVKVHAGSGSRTGSRRARQPLVVVGGRLGRPPATALLLADAVLAGVATPYGGDDAARADGKAVVAQVAVRTLPLPVRATALRPAMDNPARPWKLDAAGRRDAGGRCREGHAGYRRWTG